MNYFAGHYRLEHFDIEMAMTILEVFWKRVWEKSFCSQKVSPRLIFSLGHFIFKML